VVDGPPAIGATQTGSVLSSLMLTAELT